MSYTDNTISHTTRRHLPHSISPLNPQMPSRRSPTPRRRPAPSPSTPEPPLLSPVLPENCHPVPSPPPSSSTPSVSSPTTAQPSQTIAQQPQTPPSLTPSDAERLIYYRNPVAWFEIHGRIVRKQVGVDNANLPPQANWLQRRIGDIISWCREHREPISLIIYKPRQKGCSTITVGISYVMGRQLPLNILIIGGQESQTDNLWRQLRYYQAHDRMAWGNTCEVRDRHAKCSHGTYITRETAGDPEAGRSGTYHIVIATEVARWPTDGRKSGAEVLNSVLNCVPANEPETLKILESTANGPTGIFPDTWRAAVEFEDYQKGIRGNGYIRVFAPWHVFPDSRVPLTEAQRAAMPRKLQDAGDFKALRLQRELQLDWEQVEYYHRLLLAPECGGDVLKRDREYPTTPADGFAASGSSRFSLEGLALLDQQAHTHAARITPGVLDAPAPGAVVFRPCSAAEATVLIAEPPEPGCAYLISTDNMTGRTNVKGSDPDHNALTVLRRGHHDSRGTWQPPLVAATIPERNTWDMDIFAELVYRLHLHYGRCMVVPERNRGEYLIAELRKRGVTLYEEDRPLSHIDAHASSGRYGWLTTRETKKFLGEELARHIRQPDCPGAGLRVPFPHILSQLRTYTTHADGTEGAMTIAGCKDDFVLALGIGLCQLSAATVYHPTSSARPVPPELRSLLAEGSGRGVW